MLRKISLEQIWTKFKTNLHHTMHKITYSVEQPTGQCDFQHFLIFTSCYWFQWSLFKFLEMTSLCRAYFVFLFQYIEDNFDIWVIVGAKDAWLTLNYCTDNITKLDGQLELSPRRGTCSWTGSSAPLTKSHIICKKSTKSYLFPIPAFEDQFLTIL